jgi:hypothetical protein
VNGSLEFDLTLSGLQEDHRFVEIRCALVRRRKPTQHLTSTVLFSPHFTFRHNFTIVHQLLNPKQSSTVEFDVGTFESTPFTILNYPIKKFNSIDIRIVIAGSFNPIESCTFHWTFANPIAQRSLQLSRAVMSLLPIFMLALFSLLLQFNPDTFTQLFCFVLGITGVVGSNPLGAIFSRNTAVSPVDHILLSVYVALFRLFCAVQLDIVRRGQPTPDPLFCLQLGTFLSFFVTVSAVASFERAQQPFATLLPSEQRLFCQEICFFVIIVVLIWKTLKAAQVGSLRRIVVFTTFILVDLIGRIGLMKVIDKVWPYIMQTGIPISCGAFAIFLLHPSAGQPYEQIKSAPANSLGIEKDSREGSFDGFEEDFEEEFFEEDYDEEL